MPSLALKTDRMPHGTAWPADSWLLSTGRSAGPPMSWSDGRLKVATEVPMICQSNPGGPSAATTLAENTLRVSPVTTAEPGQYQAEPDWGITLRCGVRQPPPWSTVLLCTLPGFETELSGLAVPVIVSDIHHSTRPSGNETGTKPSAVIHPVPACPRL